MVNQDRCYDYSELNEELLIKFSEGSKSLEELLKKCYQNGIETRACCIGHKENGNPFPYISIVVKKEQFPIMEKLTELLFKQDLIKDNIKIDLSKEDNNDLYGIYFKKNEEELREKFFQLINLAINNSIINTTSSRYNNLFNTLNSYDEKVHMEIDFLGIGIYRDEIGYFKYDSNNNVVESTKEESDFSSDMSVLDTFIDSNEIEKYLKQNKKESSRGR